MRCFIAIDVDERIKKALTNLQRELQGKVDIKKSDVKWVGPEAIHLTLKFLGEMKDKEVADICNIVKDISTNHKSFELNMESVGYFGKESARVLWVGTADGSSNLLRLQKDLEEQLALAGWPAEKRKYSGHLTLCRVKNSGAGAKLAAISKNYKNFKLGVVSADSISIYQSQLSSIGPAYTLLGNYKLQ